MTTGSSISQMVMPPLITYLQEEYGFRGATLITGALVLNCCVAAMVLHPVEWHRRPTHYKNNPEHEETHNKKIPEHEETNYKNIAEYNYKNIAEYNGTYCKEKDGSAEAKDQQPNVLRRILSKITHNFTYFRSPHVMIICVIMGLNSVIILLVFNFVPFVMSRDGFNRFDSSVCLSVAGGCDLAFRLLTAFLSCCPGISALNVYRFGALVAMVGAAGFSMVESLMGKAVTLGLCGIGNGLSVSLYSVVIVEELGLPMLLPTLSITGITSSVLFLIICPLTGLIRDVTDSYVISLVFCACGLFLSFLLSLFTTAALNFERQRNYKDHLAQQPSQQKQTSQPSQTSTMREKLPFYRKSKYFTLGESN